MLKDILSISGKPGLFKLVSSGKNMLIVESLLDAKRIPAYSKDKVVSLGDIAIFTETAEVKLGIVLEAIKLKENGAACSIDSKASNDQLRKYMLEILPEYDEERVYPSDIKKILNWYNMLQAKGLVSKEEPVIENAAEILEQVVEEVKSEEKPEKKAKSKKA
jgi:hypothetical protein